MKKTSFIIAVMMAAVMLVGCGKTTTNAVTTVTPAPKAEPKVEVETSTPAPKAEPKVEVETSTPTPEAPKPTETTEVTEAPEPTETAEVAEDSKPTEAPKEAEQPKEVEAVSIEATVNGTHNVGDTLSAEDFVVTINMSDGSKVKNPAGWTANPLALTIESTEITVAYNGLTTKVTVKANTAVAKQPEQMTQPETPKPEAKPQQPANDWPASAYEPIGNKAADDIYDYSYTKGYVAKCDSSSGYDIWYVSKDDDDSCLFVVHETDGWAVVYWKSKSNDSYHSEKINAPSTLEHVYKHMFE